MTHLREIILALADAEVDFVIGGGVACVLHGKLLAIKESIDPPRDKDQLDIVALKRMLGHG